MAGIGEAIGLQNTVKQQGDPLSWLRLAGAEKRADRIRADKERKDLITKADFKVPAGILPAWGDKIAEIKAGLLNQAALDTQTDSVTAQNNFYRNLYEAQAKVSGLVAANEEALKYKALTKDKFKVDDEVQLELQRPGSTFSSIKAVIDKNKRNGFINADETGGFSFQEVPAFNAAGEAKFVYDKKEQLKNTLRPSGVAGTMIVDERESVSDNMLRAEAGRIGSQPSAIASYLWDNPDDMAVLSSGDPQAQQALGQKIAQHYEQELKRFRPVDRIGYQELKVPQSSSASAESKKQNFPVVYNTEATMKTWEKGDKKGTEKTGVMKIPVAKKVEAKPVTIQYNNMMIDPETNEFIKADQTKTFSFKPDGVELIPMRKGGYKAYATGTVVQNTEDSSETITYKDDDGNIVTVASGSDEAKKRETNYQLKVPLDETGLVKSTIYGSNQMGDFDEAVQKFMEGKVTTKSVDVSTAIRTAKDKSGKKVYLVNNEWVNEDGSPYKQ